MQHILTHSIELASNPADSRTAVQLAELGSAARLLIARTHAEQRAELSIDVGAKAPEFPGVSDTPPIFLAELQPSNAWYVAAYLAKPGSSHENPRMEYALFSLDGLDVTTPAAMNDLRRDYYQRVRLRSGGVRQLGVTDYNHEPRKVLGNLVLAVRALHKYYPQHRRAGRWIVDDRT